MREGIGKQIALALGGAVASVVATLVVWAAGGFLAWLLVGVDARRISVVVALVAFASLATSIGIAWGVHKATGAAWASAAILLTGGGLSVLLALSAYLGF